MSPPWRPQCIVVPRPAELPNRKESLTPSPPYLPPVSIMSPPCLPHVTSMSPPCLSPCEGRHSRRALQLQGLVTCKLKGFVTCCSSLALSLPPLSLRKGAPIPEVCSVLLLDRRVSTPGFSPGGGGGRGLPADPPPQCAPCCCRGGGGVLRP